MRQSGLWLAAGAVGAGLAGCDTLTPVDLTDALVLSPGDNLQEALANAPEGQRIVLRAGVYHGSCPMKTGMTLEAYPGEPVTVSGLVDLGDWKEAGGVFEHDMVAFKGRFSKHPSRQVTSDFHENRMRPELVTHDGRPMKQVYGLGALEPGCYFVSGTPGNPQTLHVRLGAGQSINRVQLAAYPQLLFGSRPGTNRVTVKGITFAYASNTGKEGLIETTGEGWVLEDVVSAYANSVGVYARGANQRFDRVTAQEAGQMGWLGKINESAFTRCQNLTPNWKGFDARWEAGCKFSNSNDNTFIDWYGAGDAARNAADLSGPLFWFDISNKRNTIRGMTLENAGKTALLVEHYAFENTFENVNIRGVQPYLSAAGTGLQIQSNVKNNTFRNFTISECASAGVRYKKTERRGPSGENTFADFRFAGNDRDWHIEGNPEALPDRFLNVGSI